MAVTADRTTGGETAEESAQEAARRIRANAERRAAASRAAPSGGSRTDGGRDPRTAAALGSLPPSWSTLITGTDARLGHVDAVAVGPGGVFVVGTSTEAGSGQGPGVGPWPETELSVRLSRAADLVSSLAGASRDIVHPVLCRSGAGGLSGMADDVLVCCPGTLVRTLTDRPPVLPASRVAATALRLEARLRTPTGAAAPARQAPDPGARAVAGRLGNGTTSPARLLVQVLLALLLLAALVVAGAQVADRMHVPPAPSQGAGSAGR